MNQDILDTMIGAGQEAQDPQAAEGHFRDGLQAEADGDRVRAIEAFRQAARLDGKAEYIFKLAYMLDLVGEEDEAVALYEQITQRERPHINALLNLAVVYEDRGEVNKAEKCLKQILDTNPNHARARLFWKDVQASRDMYYDEEFARDLAKRNALLDTPVTDFELSVRARN
ncbi:MAG: tetratricopeptide repeat protein, partial [Planctomycetota bacterium]|nr:tetratricopeptide repeat protein [Planctomycetota bacterium]